MPTYDYKCDACGHAFEAFHSITAKPLRKCPQCKASKLRRLIGTGAGVIFKGSGFYQTDYRSDSYKQAAQKESSSSTSSSGTSTTDKSSTPAASTTSDTKTTPKSEKKK